MIGDTATITIKDVELPSVYFEPATYTVTEEAGRLDVVVKLSRPSPREVVVSYRTSNLSAEAGLDYMETAGTLTFAPGETEKIISIEILKDTELEPDETFEVILISAVGAVIGGPPLLEASYYVAPGGNDNAPGTLSDPWATFQKAIAMAQAGDLIQFRGGTYNIPVSAPPIRTQKSGMATAPIVFQACPGEVPILRGAYPTIGDNNWDGIQVRGHGHWIFDGLTIQGFHTGIHAFAPAHHVTARNCQLQFNSEAGFSSVGMVTGGVEGGDYLLVEDNVICWNGFYDDGKPATRAYEGYGSGITLNAHGKPYWHDSVPGFHSRIRRNEIYHNYDGTGGDANTETHTDGNGIIIDLGGNFPSILIENNLVFDNGGRGIHPHASSNVWIVGNTLYHNNWDTKIVPSPASLCEIGGYPNGNLIVDNIHVINNIVCARPTVQLIYFPQATNLTIKNNCFYGTPYRQDYSPYGENYTRDDPEMVNPSTDPAVADFSLQATSPCLDTGATPPANTQVYDYAKVTRPQGDGYDMGALERVSS